MNEAASDSGLMLSTSLLSQMTRYMASLKMDVDGILRSKGIDPAILLAPDARISAENYIAVEEEAVRKSGDEFFGLHLGEFTEPGTYSILGYMMMNCSNLGEVFQKSARYARIVSTMIQSRAQIGLGYVKVIFSTPKNAPLLSRHCFETLFASSVKMMRSLTGQDIKPLEVSFVYSKPSSTTEFERIFRAPILFGQKHNSLTIDISLARVPVLQPNAGLLEYFENYARNFLSELDRPTTTSRRVAELLLSRLDDESLSIKAIAKEMSISVRTLQTRLNEEGKAFSEVLNDTRQSLAKKYLRENYSVDDITFLLGFSEPSVFRKAFKKWEGITPREYREKVNAISA